MIIRGFISTDKGPVDIVELKVGDRVLNQMHRAHTVTSVETVEVDGGVTFKKNPSLLLAKETSVRTLYGNIYLHGIKKTSVHMVQPNMREVRDSAVPVEGKFTAYKIKAEGGDAVFASNYCVNLEDE